MYINIALPTFRFWKTESDLLHGSPVPYSCTKFPLINIKVERECNKAFYYITASNIHWED
jgi:hypothetical protein